MRTAKTQELSFMLEQIRNNHIDINKIILEELDQLMPQYVMEIVESVYQNMDAQDE